MKTTSLLLAALLASPALLSAESSSYEITADFPFVTDYVFRGIKSAEDSIQPSLRFTSGNVYAGIWTNQPTHGSYGNEFDYTLGYLAPLTSAWSLDVGATYYDYPESSSDSAQFEPYVGLTGTFGGGLTSLTYLYYETQFEVTTLQTSLGYAIDLAPRLSLEFAGNLGGVMVQGDGDYTYWALSSTLRSKLNDRTSAYLGLTYSNTDIDHTTASTGEEVYYLTAGLSFGF